MTLLKTIDIAVISLTATAEKEKNVENACRLVREAASRGAQWVCLPEMFPFHGPYNEIFQMGESENGPLNARLSSLTKDLNIVLFAGSVGERPEGATSGKVYNTQYVFGRDGQILAKYRKVHLFNLLDASGKTLHCESEGYLAGGSFTRCVVDGWNVGLATCYDLRFSGMFEKLSSPEPLDVLITPSAFTQQTGMYHGELLCRSRAIESLCYVIASNQVGVHSPGKASYGHALVVDPWGSKICDTGNRIGVATARISKDSIRDWRAQLPVLSNRRSDIYS